MDDSFRAFWSGPESELLESLATSPKGLTTGEANQRLARARRPLKRRHTGSLRLFLAQFKSAITIILLLAAVLSVFLRDPVDAAIIILIVLVSSVLGFWQERGATRAVEKLLEIVQTKALVLRDGAEAHLQADLVVPGDIVLLSAGDAVPGDSRVLESNDLYIDEAALTGETYPVEKMSGSLPDDTPLGKRTNTVFMGTHVVSGSAKVLIVLTGSETEFGRVSQRLALKPAENEFERGIRRFGYLLMEVTFVLVLAIFGINVFFHRPVMESFMFSLALAVGLTPQLLPAIISVNLAYGARQMAEAKVIVKRLASIENLGSMDVLCSDKTGTLTEGLVRIHGALDAQGKESERVFLYAYLNAMFESGFANPLDEAIRQKGRGLEVSSHVKMGEVPYDFVRKRLSILVSDGSSRLMITKGAVSSVLDVCSQAETGTGAQVGLSTVTAQLGEEFRQLSEKGYRVLGIAYKRMGSDARIGKEDEHDMTFLGWLVLEDPLKADIVETVKELRDIGITLKMISGDNRVVAARVCNQLGVENPRVLTGPELRVMSDAALLGQVTSVDAFAEVEPNQKERIILALKKAGRVVGYMGDGINDVSALHAADVSISVDDAVDVADIVLLEHDLRVLIQGVRDGRATFANTMKYMFMATSANFGNMFSMAGASLFLPFLPLLPKQVLLLNLTTDFPEMTIAGDNVDEEMLERPRRWDLGFIRDFMVVFGLLSSVFDYLTFGVLILILHASADQFRTCWFLESVISATLIVLVVRSRRPFFRSLPGRYLTLATCCVLVFALLLPLTPLGGLLGLPQIPGAYYVVIALVVAVYIFCAEVVKGAFYRRVRA